jgi:hypothetical protein
VIAVIGEGSRVGLRQMMGIHHKLTHASRQKMIEGIGDKRLMENRDEGLRELVREWPKPLTETRAEDEGFLHARLLSGTAAGANLNPADHAIFADLNAFGSGHFGQGWHAHHGAGEGDEESGTIGNFEIAHGDAEVTRTAEFRGIIRE